MILSVVWTKTAGNEQNATYHNIPNDCLYLGMDNPSHNGGWRFKVGIPEPKNKKKMQVVTLTG